MDRLEVGTSMIDRTSGLGSSDSPIVYGCSPYMRPLQLWRLKLGLDQPQEESEAMWEGKRMEPFIREAAEEQYRRIFEPAIVQSASWHWSQLDGLSQGPKGTGTILECKHTKLGAKDMASNPPMHWQVQLAHQMHDYMAVYAHRPSVLLATSDGVGFWFDCPKVSDSLIASVYASDKAFWDLVTEKTPPADDDYREDRDWQAAAAEYLEWKEAVDQASAELEIARGALLELAKGQHRTYGHGVIAQWKRRSGSLDAAAMVADGINIEKYRREPSMYWEVRKG